MPYETLLDEMMAALRRPLETHRSAVVASLDELRGVLAAHRGEGSDRGDRLARELGPFAGGRIDSRALASILSLEERILAPGSAEVLERAVHVLTAAADDLEEKSLLRVPPGGDLRDVVRDALTATGAVFGVARAAELARRGAYRPDEHNALFSGKPFRRWTAAERSVAPPLLVVVDGGDLRPAGLADFLDGAVKIALLVRGEAPPAALSRVITPGVAVMQTTDPADVERVAESPGPALAAVFADDTGKPVPFAHDPAAGDLPWERLRVDADLDELRERLETTRWKDRTHEEDLAHLVALAHEPGAAPAGSGADAGAVGKREGRDDAGVDHLAAWLLASSELES